jgi:hypothetical protein
MVIAFVGGRRRRRCAESQKDLTTSGFKEAGEESPGRPARRLDGTGLLKQG